MATKPRNKRNKKNKKQANQFNRVTSVDVGRVLIREPERIFLSESGNKSWVTTFDTKGEQVNIRSKTAERYVNKMARAF
jgi:hypothetical protein